MSSQGNAFFKLSGIYLAAACAGFAASRAGLPLPWMIGPLLMTGLLVFTGLVNVVVPVSTRPFGQSVVASQVGLYFTPVAFTSLMERAPLLIGMALLTVLASLGIAFMLSRMSRISLSNALIATLPTSPVEAAVIAERCGFNPTPIILAHTFRITAVVVLIPLGIYAIDGMPDRSAAREIIGFDPAGNLLLALVAFAGAVSFRKLRISNPYFLGPLAFASVLTAANFHLPPFPSVVLWAAQIVLGTWLGSMLRRQLFMSAGRLMGATIVTTLLFIGVTAGMGLVVAQLMDMDWETLVLASAPGGVTEMALTASYMGSNVALVTAFHITRIFMIVPNIPWIIRLLHRLDRG